MDHEPEAAVAHVPVTTVIIGKIDGLLRTELHADAAAFTMVINKESPVMRTYRFETAQIGTLATTDAVLLTDPGAVSRDERRAFLDLRLQQDVQVGRIHIQVTDDLAFGQMGKGGTDRGFARPALAADDDDLTHDRLLRRTSARHRAGIRTAPSIPARLRQ